MQNEHIFLTPLSNCYFFLPFRCFYNEKQCQYWNWIIARKTKVGHVDDLMVLLWLYTQTNCIVKSIQFTRHSLWKLWECIFGSNTQSNNSFVFEKNERKLLKEKSRSVYIHMKR